VWVTWETPGNPRCGMCDVTAFTVRGKGIGAGMPGANSGRGALSTGIGLTWRLPQLLIREPSRAVLRSPWGDETPPHPPALSGCAHLGTRGALARLHYCACTPQRSPTELAPAVGEE